MKKSILLIVATLAFCTSCKKSYDLNVNQSATEQDGTLTICTRSTLTGKNLAGVKIAVVGSPKDTVTTDATGVASLKLPAGSYELQLTAEGYASIHSERVDIQPINGESATPIFGETHQDINMYAIGATLEGRVVMQAQDQNEATYVQGATIAIVDLNGSRTKLVEPILATTNDEGLFSIQVPVHAQLSPVFYYVTNGLNYSASISSVSLNKGETKLLQTTMLTPNVAGSYTADKVTAPRLKTDVLKVTFPTAIATAKVLFTDISVSGADSLNFRYEDAGRTIVISPLPRYSVTNPDAIATAKNWTVGSHTFQINGIKGTKNEDLNATGRFTIPVR